MYHLIDYIIILLACISADSIMIIFDYYRKYKVEEMLCDVCRKPKKLISSKDKRLWLCRGCAKVYKANTTE